jgi:hypothetical protein
MVFLYMIIVPKTLALFLKRSTKRPPCVALPHRWQYELRLDNQRRHSSIATRDPGLPHHGGTATVQGRAFGTGRIPDRDGGEEVGFAFDGGRRRTLWQIGYGGNGSERIRERHHCPAMQHRWSCAEILADLQHSFDAIRGDGDKFQAE